ncbi:MAG: tRNA preQ1(34) S-adenosylmethionine ribosyltransferase-isomerase QueA [Leptospirales bacterium]
MKFSTQVQAKSIIRDVSTPLPVLMQRKVVPDIEPYLYELPEELIAKYPSDPPDHCRMLLLDRKSGDVSQQPFYALSETLQEGDLLLINDTAVEARRVFMRRSSLHNKNSTKIQGARIETVFLQKVEPENNKNPGSEYWKALVKKRQRLNDGELLTCEKNPDMEFIVHKKEDGRTILESKVPLTSDLFFKIGQMPIPPYLKREEENGDRENYQNPFGKYFGSAAAPTASLHFTDTLQKKLRAKGVQIAHVTLHVGYGTFAPLTKENFETKSLHPEYYVVDEKTADILRQKKYNRLIAVGTTTLRVLETVYQKSEGRYDSFLEGETNIFLKPPYEIKSVDGLITNFHLPGSSLLMLVSCMTKKEFIMNAYDYAIHNEFMFFSYGDTMLIV